MRKGPSLRREPEVVIWYGGDREVSKCCRDQWSVEDCDWVTIIAHALPPSAPCSLVVPQFRVNGLKSADRNFSTVTHAVAMTIAFDGCASIAAESIFASRRQKHRSPQVWVIGDESGCRNHVYVTPSFCRVRPCIKACMERILIIPNSYD